MEEEGLDTEGVVSQSKLRSKVKALSGIDILTDTGAYKSTYQILSEIAEVWEDMDDMEQAALLEILAGKRAGSVMSAILQNPDTLKDAFESANNAAGSALAENEKYLDSIQGRLDLFTNAIQTLWNNTLDDEIIKQIIDLGTKLVQLVDDIGLVKLAFMGLGTYMMKKFNLTDALFGNETNDPDTVLRTLELNVEGAKAKFEKRGSARNAQKVVKAEDNLKEYQSHLDDLKGLQDKQTKLLEDQQKAQEILNGNFEGDSEFAKLSKKVDEAQQKVKPKGKRSKQSKKALKTAQQDLENYKTQQIDEAKTSLENVNAELQTTGEQIDAAKLKTNELGASMTGVGQNGKLAFQKLKSGLKSFGKQLGQVAKSMLTMYAITTVLELVGKAFAAIKEAINDTSDSVEKSQEKFNELSNELSDAKSDLRSLESELDTTKDRIDELLEMDSLSFVEQEELNTLRAQSSELETQIALAETLVETLEEAAGLAGLNAAQQTFGQTSFYSEQSKTERQEEAAENGKSIGQTAGLIIGGIVGAVLAPFTGGSSLALVGVGAGAGALIGGGIGEAAGAASEASTYDSEKTVAEVLTNMRTERAALEQARDNAYKAYAETGSEASKQIWEDAQAALGKFDGTLANNISSIQQYINSIDPEKLTNAADKAYYTQMKQWLDSYTVMMGGPEGLQSVISQMFDEDTMTDGAKALKNTIEEALGKGEYIDFTDFQGEEFAGVRAELEATGVSVTSVISYFEALANAEDAASYYETSDLVESIAKLSSGISSLKSAFDEFNESGVVSAEILIELAETFSHLEDPWTNFLDIMSSGVASTNEAADAVNELAEAYLGGILTNPFTFVDDPDTEDADERINEYQRYITTISQLQSLGVQNAKELVDAMNQEALSNAIVKQIKADQKEIDELTAKDNRTEEDEKKLAELRAKNSDDYIKSEEEKYGITLKNTQLIEDQLKLNEIEEEREIYKGYSSQFSGQNDILRRYQDSIEITKGLKKELGDLEADKRFINEWLDKYDVPIMEKLWVALFGSGDTRSEQTIKKYKNDLKATDALITTQNGLISDQTTIRQELFNDLIAMAKDANIDLSDINLDAFNPDDLSENSIFNQVYNKAKPVIEAKVQELEELEDELNTKIGTAFDEVGLEVRLELLDKSKLVDDIQSIYDELKNAQKEYAESGYLSVDTMQSLLQLEPKYLDLLVDENGNLNLNEQALLEVARARIIDLGIKQQSAILDQALALATSGSAEAIMEQVSVMETATAVSGDWVEAKMAEITAMIQARVAAGDLTQAEADAFINGTTDQIKAVQATTNAALKDLGNTLSASGNTTKAEVDDTFQKTMDYWENRIAANQAKYDQVQNEIDLLEKQGKRAGKEYYEEQIRLENERIRLLQQQKAAAIAYMNSQKEGSEEWWEAAKIVNDLEGELDDATANIFELSDAMAQIPWDTLTKATDRFSSLHDELSDIRDILQSDDMFDEEGNWTEAGVGVLGTYVQDLEMYKNEIAQINGELAKLEREYQGNKSYYKDLGIDSEQELYDKREELAQQQRDYIKGAEDTAKAIADSYSEQVDAIEDYTNELVDSYNDYIDVVKKALDQERDLYEFKKNIKKQTKDIASLERRIASLSGSINAADIAERRKLEKD